MKKFIFGILTLFATSFAFSQPQLDQAQIFLSSYSVAYQKALTTCQEKGYNYFLFKTFSYRDKIGQTMEIQGVCLDEGGISIKDEIIDHDLGIDISYQLICFREKPQDEKAVDVVAFMEMVNAYQQAEPEKVEGSLVTEIGNLEELNKELKNAKTPVYLECYSQTCPPCKMLSPKFDTYSKDLSEKGKFLKVDLAEVSEVAATYEVMQVPTLLVFENGKLKETKQGLPDILSFFESIK